ncbi:MAG: hypothetical protein F4246_09140 [Rhodothermaceae bacterium]|nr:hypothetical protein [Rhodothermaceae bacterium]MXX59548.1 hypothetical protein [Rhodothermaceae bacterium]MYD19658.1 hypothetical protein [Rhodothermaceae bacterium]MYD57166.1 hypothetical protein [Rhodothermaceae bacterium]MYI44010.1 hypothetical protein [Rhodothermaceae bacterium]
MACLSGQIGRGVPLTGPGKAHRTGLTLLDIMRLLPDEAANKWYKVIFWLDGRCTLSPKVPRNAWIHRQAGQYDFALFNRRFRETCQ